MKKNKTLKWEIKDVIAVVLLSLFLILIQFIVNMVYMILRLLRDLSYFTSDFFCHHAFPNHDERAGSV